MSYTVKQLKADIAKLPDDMVVYVQKDAEGNGYRVCAGADPDGVLIDDSYHAEIYSGDWSADDADMDEDEWEEFKSKPRVLVIYPN